MNILILTSVNATNIVEMIENMIPYYTEDNTNHIFSIQSMALLSEETFNKPYMTYNYLYSTVVAHKADIICDNNAKYNIVYGNLDKNTPIKFDHIFMLESDAFQTHDLALEKFEAICGETAPVKWYKPEDAEYRFPTFKHLALMLETLGVNKCQR